MRARFSGLGGGSAAGVFGGGFSLGLGFGLTQDLTFAPTLAALSSLQGTLVATRSEDPGRRGAGLYMIGL